MSSAPPAAGSHALRERPIAGVYGITAAAEAHRLDREGRHAGFRDLDREVMLVTRFVGPLATFFVDADDVIHAPAVAGHAQHDSRRAARSFWKEEIREHADAGLAVEDDLLTHVSCKRACLQCRRTKRRPRCWKTSDELGQLHAKCFLPRLGVAAIAGAEPKLPRGSLIQAARVRDRVEPAVAKVSCHSGEWPVIGGAARALRTQCHCTCRCESARQAAEFTARKLGHPDPLKRKSRPELNSSHITRRADLRKRRGGAEVRSRVHQVDDVEHVRRLQAKLQRRAASEVDVAKHSQVDVPQAGAVDDAPRRATIGSDGR